MLERYLEEGVERKFFVDQSFRGVHSLTVLFVRGLAPCGFIA